MSYIGSKQFLLEVSKGNVAGHSLVHKFGRNSAVGTTIVPIADGGNYQMPTSAQSLEFVSDATEDALDDVGMHELTINGLDANGDFQEVTTAAHATDGLTAVAITGTWLRVFRAWVSKSGAYATQSTASHEGKITLRTSGGGATWLTIPEVATNFGAGQSLCGFYTVPAGKTAYILSAMLTIDSVKSVDIYFYRRSSITDTTSSYDGTMRLQNVYVGVAGGPHEIIHLSNESYPELTDLGFMGVVSSGTADVSTEFELLLVDN